MWVTEFQESKFQDDHFVYQGDSIPNGADIMAARPALLSKPEIDLVILYSRFMAVRRKEVYLVRLKQGKS